MPVLSGTLANMRPNSVSRDAYHDIAADIDNLRLKSLTKSFHQERARYDHETAYLDVIPKLSRDYQDNVIDRNSPFNDKCVREILRKYSVKPFNGASPHLATFIREFVTAVNTYKLAPEQAETLFAGYFESPLRDDVEDNLHSHGLPYTIRELYVHKCTRRKRDGLVDRLVTFKFGANSENILSDVYDFQNLVRKVNPTMSIELIQAQTKERMLQQLSATDRRTMIKADSTFLKKYGQTLTFHRWLDVVDKKGITFGHRAAQSHNINIQEEHYDPLHVTAADLAKYEARFIRETMQATTSDPTFTRPPTTNVNEATHRPSNDEKARAAPIFIDSPEYKSATRNFTTNQLVDRSRGIYPDDHQQDKELPLSWVGNKFVPHKKILAMPSPHMFYVNNQGRTVMNNRNQAHFRNRCAACGMEGHTAAHAKCPQRSSTSTWDICPNCQAGLHDTCRLAPNNVTFLVRDGERRGPP